MKLIYEIMKNLFGITSTILTILRVMTMEMQTRMSKQKGVLSEVVLSSLLQLATTPLHMDLPPSRHLLIQSQRFKSTMEIIIKFCLKLTIKILTFRKLTLVGCVSRNHDR